MSQVSWMVAAGVGAAVTCQLAVADVPDVMGQIPTDAAVVFVMPHLGEVTTAIQKLEDTFGAEMDGPGEVAQKLAALEGIDLGRSAGMFIPGGFDPENDMQPPFVALIPVKDFDAFVGALGGEVADGIATLEIEGEPGYAKKVGGGYAAVAPVREVIEMFEAGEGNGAAHEKRLGKIASAASMTADVFVAADIQLFAEQIKTGFQEFGGQMQMMGMMAGQDFGPQTAMVNALGERLVSDGRIGFFALDVSEEGVAAGFGVQFDEESETAGFLTGGGSSSRLLAKLPAKNMLFAYAADMSSPGSKKLNAAMRDAMGEQGGIPGLKEATADADGAAMILGKSAGGLMGGALFAASSMYLQVPDPKAHVQKLRESLEAMNGQTVEGTTFQTSFTPGAAEAEGTSLDAWSVRMQLDPAMGGQAAMAMGMIFGAAGGPSGYIAPTADGMVMTLSKNTQLATEALNAAKSGKGLADDTLVKSVAKHLPEDRSMEVYVGFGNIVEIAMGFMAMSPMGPLDVEIPQNLAPVGFATTTGSGAFGAQLFAPAGVLTLIKDLGEAMEEAQGGAAGPAEEGGRPRF